ncbi:MAG TPA: acyl-CoA dehydrogenase family protein, partial [Anaerolineales bacterium]|nr:acyl-CoA dehydrogenase family protein [Anaerolineales bacterium]
MTDLPIYPLSSEHKMLRDTARDFAQKEIAPIAAELDESGEFPRNTMKKMGELGFMGIEVPEEYGGAGMDALAYVLALEEICKVDASHGVIMSVNNSLYCHGILKFGSEKQKKAFITPIASGRAIGAYSLTEPQSGSDAGSLKSQATRDGDFYVLNGRKSWVTSGPVADYIIVFMMTDPENDQKGISAFLVDGKTKGLTRGKKEPKLGIRASATSELIFENCRVPVENRLGAEGEGFKIAMTVLDAGRIGIATQALGIAESAYEAARQYAGQREAFGQPIGAFQG